MKIKVIPALLAIVFVLCACGNAGQNGESNKQAQNDVKAEKASSKTSPASLLIPLKNQEGKKVGQAQFLQTARGVRIIVEATGLKPGEHGMHIHETGKCTPPDFKSAGKHFNPFGKEHGFDNPKGPHAGDLPNVIAEENGTVQTEVVAKYVTLKKGNKASLFDANGSALVIHAKPDDYKSQPAGNAGARIICGEITDRK